CGMATPSSARAVTAAMRRCGPRRCSGRSGEASESGPFSSGPVPPHGDSLMVAISPDRIAAILRRQEEVQAAMARSDLDPAAFVRLSKDYAELEPVTKAAGEVE